MGRPRTYKEGAHRAKILLPPGTTRTVAKAWAIMLNSDPDNAPKDQTSCVARLVEMAFAQLQKERAIEKALGD